MIALKVRAAGVAAEKLSTPPKRVELGLHDATSRKKFSRQQIL
jgi:hypothetical protein